MSKLSSLHESFIMNARKSTIPRFHPITARDPDRPIVPMERWETKDDGRALLKRFLFRRGEDRNRFVTDLLEYESEVGHHATLVVSKDAVTVGLTTHTIDRTTELDYEYAKFADVLYKDVVARPESFGEGSNA